MPGHAVTGEVATEGRGCLKRLFGSLVRVSDASAVVRLRYVGPFRPRSEVVAAQPLRLNRQDEELANVTPEVHVSEPLAQSASEQPPPPDANRRKKSVRRSSRTTSGRRQGESQSSERRRDYDRATRIRRRTALNKFINQHDLATFGQVLSQLAQTVFGPRSTVVAHLRRHDNDEYIAYVIDAADPSAAVRYEAFLPRERTFWSLFSALPKPKAPFAVAVRPARGWCRVEALAQMFTPTK